MATGMVESMGPAGVRRGERHPNSVLTDAAVRSIRELHAQGYGYIRIGKIFGISGGQARRIVKRTAWAHVA